MTTSALVLGMAVAGCHRSTLVVNPRLTHLTSASWDASSGTGQVQGLRPLKGADGLWVVTPMGGSYSLAPPDGSQQAAYYLYCRLDASNPPASTPGGSASGSPAGSQGAEGAGEIAPVAPVAGADSAPHPLYAAIDYYDGAPGTPLELEYDSMQSDDPEAIYHAADGRQGGERTGSQSWRTAIFRLSQPRFQARQNLQSDFRVKGTHLNIRSITLRPAGAG